MPESNNANTRASRHAPVSAPEDARAEGEKGNRTPLARATPAEEIGGQAGPEPTRYGDWERNGRCTDF